MCVEMARRRAGAEDLGKIQQNFTGHFETHARTSDYAEIAQLVEHFPEEEGVAGSSPALGTV